MQQKTPYMSIFAPLPLILAASRMSLYATPTILFFTYRVSHIPCAISSDGNTCLDGHPDEKSFFKAHFGGLHILKHLTGIREGDRGEGYDQKKYEN